MNNVLLVIGIGLLAGFAISIIFHFLGKTQGVFLVNTTDPDKDVYRVEFTIPLGAIPKYKIIRLRVIDESSRE